MVLTLNMRECFHIHFKKNVVTKFELPKIEDLHLTTVQFDSKCSYLDMGSMLCHNY